MGTNYYITLDACACCGRGGEELHIGKSSGGWCFSLNTHPENGIESLEDWKAVWADKPIKDEYGNTINPDEMLRIITQRTWRGEFPRRHAIDGSHCLDHGDGTWDVMRGEFS